MVTDGFKSLIQGLVRLVTMLTRTNVLELDLFHYKLLDLSVDEFFGGRFFAQWTCLAGSTADWRRASTIFLLHG